MYPRRRAILSSGLSEAAGTHLRVRGEKRRYGYRRIQVLMRQEGWWVNRKRMYRIYRDAALQCGDGSENG